MTDQPKYTLPEAKLKLNQDECALRGHDYEIILTIGRDGPQQILCNRCGKSWNIEGANRSRTSERLIP